MMDWINQSLTWIDALPDVIKGVLITGVVALAVAWLNARITAGQLQVQQQTLFVSMLQRRLDWLDSFRKAVRDWEREMAERIRSARPEDLPEPVALFEVASLRQDATWLFDPEVARLARAVEAQLEILVGTRTTAASGQGEHARNAAMQVGASTSLVYERLNDLMRATQPSIYVGDIRRPPSVVKISRRIGSTAGEAFMQNGKPL